MHEKRIDGISDIRDESDRNGMRIVIELKRDANAQVVLNLLYKHTQLQDTFGAIMLALVDNKPCILSLKESCNTISIIRLMLLQGALSMSLIRRKPEPIF